MASSAADADLVVRGRFLLPGASAPTPAALAVREGRVLALARDVDAAGARVVEFGDRLVMPGATDPHVHFRDPGHPEKEDFGSGSTAAAFGGVTAVLDMPNTNPPTTTAAAFDDKVARAAAKSVVDFGVYCGLAGEASIGLLDRATAMKIYLGATTGDLLTTDFDLVEKALQAAARFGKRVAVHAEDQGCLEAHAAAEGAPAGDDWAWHARSRPNSCEADALARVAALPAAADGRVHVAHLSTAEGLAVATRAGFSSEVTPHHLHYTAHALAERGGALKMNPPLRSVADRDALWAALSDGRIDCLGSDHAPHTPGEKARGVVECPAGVPGVETMVPLLMAEVATGRFPVARLQDAACRRPAELFGLPKGRFAPGYDADFAVWDLDAVAPVSAETLHSRAGWTPYEGMPAVFPTDVWLRGEPVVTDRALVGASGRALFLDGRFREP